MRSNIKKCIAVFAFLLLLSVSIGAVSGFLDKTDVDEKYKQFFAGEENFDVIFMGTSHTYNTVMPQELWDGYSIPSYNWGNSNCSIPVDYYVLRMLCEYTSPKLVVIDLFGLAENENMQNGKYRTDVRDQQRVQFDAFPLSPLKVEAVQDIFDDYENNWDFLLKLGIYHNRWSEITKHNFEPRNIPQKGAAFVLGVRETEYREITDTTPYTVDVPAMEYLVKIIEFCREREIKLLFTYLPFAAEQKNADAAASFAEYFTAYPDCAYLNMLNTGIIDYRTDVYYDGSHLNYLGSVAITEYLGEYITARYPEVVHTDDPAYAVWDAHYDEYVDYKISRFKDGAFYDNLQLLLGDDFYGEIAVRENYVGMFGEDRTAQNLIRRLGTCVSVKVIPTEEATAAVTFSVTDRRSGAVVFQNTVVP